MPFNIQSIYPTDMGKEIFGKSNRSDFCKKIERPFGTGRAEIKDGPGGPGVHFLERPCSLGDWQGIAKTFFTEQAGSIDPPAEVDGRVLRPDSPDDVFILLDLPFEVILYDMPHVRIRSGGRDSVATNTLPENQHVLAHTHIGESAGYVSQSDIMSAYYYRSRNPGARRFIIHTGGIIEYVPPEDSMIRLLDEKLPPRDKGQFLYRRAEWDNPDLKMLTGVTMRLAAGFLGIAKNETLYDVINSISSVEKDPRRKEQLRGMMDYVAFSLGCVVGEYKRDSAADVAHVIGLIWNRD